MAQFDVPKHEARVETLMASVLRVIEGETLRFKAAFAARRFVKRLPVMKDVIPPGEVLEEVEDARRAVAAAGAALAKARDGKMPTDDEISAILVDAERTEAVHRAFSSAVLGTRGGKLNLPSKVRSKIRLSQKVLDAVNEAVDKLFDGFVAEIKGPESSPLPEEASKDDSIELQGKVLGRDDASKALDAHRKSLKEVIAIAAIGRNLTYDFWSRVDQGVKDAGETLAEKAGETGTARDAARSLAKLARRYEDSKEWLADTEAEIVKTADAWHHLPEELHEGLTEAFGLADLPSDPTETLRSLALVLESAEGAFLKQWGVAEEEITAIARSIEQPTRHQAAKNADALAEVFGNLA